MAYSEKQIEQIFDKICTRISEGETLRKVLKEDSMPDAVTFYKWLDSDSEKRKIFEVLIKNNKKCQCRSKNARITNNKRFNESYIYIEN